MTGYVGTHGHKEAVKRTIRFTGEWDAKEFQALIDSGSAVALPGNT